MYIFGMNAAIKQILTTGKHEIKILSVDAFELELLDTVEEKRTLTK